jgi:hypothetical protein
MKPLIDKIGNIDMIIGKKNILNIVCNEHTHEKKKGKIKRLKEDYDWGMACKWLGFRIKNMFTRIGKIVQSFLGFVLGSTSIWIILE